MFIAGQYASDAEGTVIAALALPDMLFEPDRRRTDVTTL
ncbi:hypothetical protein FB558_4049 [Pseudonocardia kunmingensis]|uniref:Uncharacterized protein n=1 Tax=Pseudonocardia kunmingensis TaxID=630975 RepID=A0A543DQ86_9PSEU|nr:hypothetical protein FB558_4049 [Pseudonocardia kunmingensis]